MMRTRALRVLAAVIPSVFWAFLASAETIALHPSADATLLEVNPNNSSGGADFFNAGTTQNRTRNRALIKFDVASALPPGAQISAATLHVEVVRSPKDGFEVGLFGIHPMLRSWGEGSAIPTDNPGGLGAPAMPGDATWLHRFAFSELWAAPGGAPGIDYAFASSSSTFIYSTGIYEFEGTLDMIRDVQSWLDNTNANFGWMLMTEMEEVNFTARRFASREDLGGGPVLTIEYTVVPEPGILVLGSFAIAISVLACRRHKASSDVIWIVVPSFCGSSRGMRDCR